MIFLSFLAFWAVQENDLDRILSRFERMRTQAQDETQLRRAVDETRGALEKYLRDFPKAADAGRATYHLAQMFLHRADYVAAIERLDDYVARYPNDVQVATARFQAAELSLYLERDADARRRFEEWIARHPNDERSSKARLSLAVLLTYEKKFTEAARAIEDVRKEWKGRPQEWPALLQLATCHHLAENSVEARRALEEVIRGCPESSVVAAAKRLLGEYACLGRELPSDPEAELRLSTYRGHVVVLYFFSSALPFAEDEAAFLRKIRDRLKDQGLVLLGVSIEPDRERFERFKSEQKIPWPLFYDGGGLDGKLARLYSVRGLPSLTVVDKQGRGRFFNLGGRDLRLAVEKLLEEK